MPYDWNPAKRLTNLIKHGVDFQAVRGFDWDRCIVNADTREHYNEVRLIALGAIGDRLHVLVFTIRAPSIWLISLRKANNREITRYEHETAS